MKNIVYLFSGRAGSGKDTSYNFFRKMYLDKFPDIIIKKYAFGDALKKIFIQLSELFLGIDFSFESMESLTYKETPHDEVFMYLSDEKQPLVIRKMLQQIGTNILRKELGENIFGEAVVDQLKNQFFGNENQVAMITDLRFVNEYECIKNFCDQYGYEMRVIYIQRNNVPHSSHLSESYFNLIPKDFTIDNNGYIIELELQLLKILETVSK